MACAQCQSNPVIQLPTSQDALCKSCFFDYFEKKVFKTIREYALIQDGDHLGVAVSGGKDSTTVLSLVQRLVRERKDLKLTAIAIDEGIHGYRDVTLEGLQHFCAREKVDLRIFSFAQEFGKNLDTLVKTFPNACSICGVLRRYLLNTKAKALGITKVVTGHNLDDEAQSVVMNQFRRNVKISARLGPITGVVKDARFIPRIKPLYFLSEKEVATYAYLKGFVEKYSECPHASDSYRAKVRDMIYAFDAQFPGTKQNIINAFLEILPLLKKQYTQEMRYCQGCGEPAAQALCRACQLIEQVVKAN